MISDSGRQWDQVSLLMSESLIQLRPNPFLWNLVCGDPILAYNIFHGRLDLPQAEFERKHSKLLETEWKIFNQCRPFGLASNTYAQKAPDSPSQWPHKATPFKWSGVNAMKKHRPDGAHTGPGHTYGQRHEKGPASSTEYLFSRAPPASLRPHFGLQHIPRSPWLATGGIFWGASGARPSRTWLLFAPPQFSLTPNESILLCETSHLVE